jgi:PLP dependent protein
MTTLIAADIASHISDNITAIRARIATAARSAGRDPAGVTLVAVSKQQPEDRIRAALQAGHRVFGENRVQEAAGRWPVLKAEFPGVELRLIGHLQTNKVKQALSLFDVIETVDRPSLAAALAAEMARAGKRIPCLVEVNTGEEAQKGGVMPGDADAFIRLCRETHGLPIQGLMCIPPLDEEPSLHFALLREIGNRNGLTVLSMGMSADYEIAVRLGATHVRVGTAVFGARGSLG